ncbi:MAG: hypothetical protein R2794_00050 [Chitinophagales bacterium]
MSENVLHTLLLATAFIVLFGIAEIMYHTFSVPAETTRKIVHVGTGLLTLLFPVYISDHWFVLALCSSFFILLWASQHKGWFPSIHAVDRETVGGLMFPIIVYGCFLLFKQFGEMHMYYIPILILTFSDTCAELAGKKWPLKKYHFGGSQKSIGGSLAFFISALIIAFLFLQSNAHVPLLNLILYSTSIAVCTTIAEGLSGKGYDNLTIPAVTAILLLVLHTFDCVQT